MTKDEILTAYRATVTRDGDAFCVTFRDAGDDEVRCRAHYDNENNTKRPRWSIAPKEDAVTFEEIGQNAIQARIAAELVTTDDPDFSYKLVIGMPMFDRYTFTCRAIRIPYGSSGYRTQMPGFKGEIRGVDGKHSIEYSQTQPSPVMKQKFKLAIEDRLSAMFGV